MIKVDTCGSSLFYVGEVWRLQNIFQSKININVYERWLPIHRHDDDENHNSIKAHKTTKPSKLAHNVALTEEQPSDFEWNEA